ncbi:ROK family protein [Novosphingobium sp. 1949]|uniref:fructokinase n=1 Tax=Novosphingobium organovorum TaxID=2930092 RepID=A0ABT0BEE2_9SPHN|nr:ROK family protein [Novosphingobium organovorum]MCJ2183369.1 ROK family protein [Novosphingobium organovorum]
MERNQDMTLFGAIEAGGTKFVCAVGSAGRGSLRTATIPTRDPQATFADVAAFFAEAADLGPLGGIGVGSFGPVRIDPEASDYGRILRTPKPGWEGFNILEGIRAFSGVPLALDTDVNTAALAELALAGPAVRQLAYVTVGTGIGVGFARADGGLTGGFAHPEMGHILVRRHPLHGDFAGNCPFHGDCLEGLAAGPALIRAWGLTPSHIPEEHPFWETEADYLAQLCMTLFLTCVPDRIVFGGGVMKQERLFPMIRARTLELLAGYLQGADEAAAMEARITAPLSSEPPGLIGAYQLIERRLRT